MTHPAASTIRQAASAVLLLACFMTASVAAQTGTVPTLTPGVGKPTTPATGTGTAAPTAPPAVNAPAPPSGKFRFTINGFVVNNATRDHILDIDGVGDEVFVSANVVVVDSALGYASPLTTLESRIYGEKRRDIGGRFVWPARSAIGTGTPMGGLRTGNQAPGAEPWKRKGGVSPEYLPLEVWCGTLTQGQNAVIIVPSIWEWDGETSVFGEWTGWANTLASSLSGNPAFLALVGQTGSAITLGANLVLGAAVSLDSTGLVGGERDRPIGVKRSTTKPKAFDFVPPHRFVLNYKSADLSTRESVAGSVGGMAPGTYQLQYTDDPFFMGRYTLYAQIERIDGGKCLHEGAGDFGGKAPPKP